MYVLVKCGLIHKYLLKKSDLEKIKEETLFTVEVVKDLSGYTVESKNNNLILSNGAEVIIFKRVENCKDEFFIYFLDEFGIENMSMMNSKVQIQLPDDISKIDKQIVALKAIILKDNPKDRAIHVQAIRDLEEHKRKLEMR